MRILRISGAGLASLADRFEVDFERPPLDGAGLFAISGPTGAGKSTLLDAMCLALFDRTPRLSERGGAPIGRAEESEEQRLGSNDVRSVLRRGAVEGWAEVRFVGRDGRRYEARWHCYRARHRANGKLQPQSVVLTEVEGGTTLGQGKKDTLAKIEEKLGLTFDQFRRSVLLAQGEFAAFLEADPDQRAELLERMTGTDLYRGLSRAAFERAKQERETFTLLERELGGSAPLGSEERASLERALESARGLVAEKKGRLDQVEAALAWHRKLAEWVADEKRAEEVLAGAEEAWKRAEPIRTALADAEAVEPLRPLVAEVDSLELDLERGRRAFEERGRALSEATVTAERVAVELAAAERLRDGALDQERKLAPRIVEARALDQQVALARREHERTLTARTEAQGALELARAKAAEAMRSRDEVAERVRGAETWRGAHEASERLAQNWERAREDLRRWTAERKRKEDVARDLSALGEARDALSAALAKLSAEELELGAATEGARAELEKQEALPPTDPAALRNERGELHRRRELLTALGGLVAQAAKVSEERDAATGERDQALIEGKAARAKVVELEEDSRALAGELKLERLLLERAKETLGFDERRALLVPGEPCPLCGALEHPHAGAGGFSALVEKLVGKVEALEERSSELGTLLGAAQSRAASQEALASEAERRVASSEVELERLAVERRVRVERLGEAFSTWASEADPAAAAVTGALESVAARLEAVEARELEAERWAKAREEARGTYDGCARALEALRTRSANLEVERAELARKRELAAQSHGHAEGQEKNALEDLRGALGVRPGWEERLADHPQRFEAELEAEVEAWSRTAGELDQAREALPRLEAELAGASARVEQLEQEHARTSAEHAAAERALSELQKARADLFEGRPTDEVEQASRAETHAAREAVEGLGEQVKKVEAARRTLEGGQSAARSELDGRAALLAARRTALEGELAQRKLSGALLRERLGHDAAWRALQRGRLEALERARVEARAVLGERAARRAAHEENARPELDAAGAQAERAEAAAAHEAAEAGLREQAILLREDESARARASTLTEKLEALRPRVERWARLSELIGAADGKKFALFAQSLTLDALLAGANQHLENLARRYRLQRVPGRDLDLQVVDLELGEEVRSANSLSGGERFLVSLALALGLSSLSSRDTRIESLFIDEGFGTLDPQTLDVALATLDALQASGRQVGLISHVPGLAERIGVGIQVEPLSVGRGRVRVGLLAA